MSRVAYVNGRYVPHDQAQVHIEDRGLQFADGVYEVIAVLGHGLIDLPGHHRRLHRSLDSLRIPFAMSDAALGAILGEVVRRNQVREGIVYLQVNRGRAPRNHAFPTQTQASVIVTARRARPSADGPLSDGVRVITVDDQRWARCDIKSVSLIGNVLAKQAAIEADCFEAWQVDRDGLVTEGAQSNAWIVDQDGALITRPLGNDVLAGITRERVIALARQAGLTVHERAFTPAAAKAAREAFLTSTSSFVVPVVQIDDSVIANGRPGSTTERVRALYLEFAGL